MSKGAVGLLLVMALAFLNSSVFVPPSMAQTCTVEVPHIEGQWTTLPYLMPINPISATLLHTGQVLIVSGSENDASNNSPGAEETYRSAIWDPTGTTQGSITVQNVAYDIFCSGTAALPDGRPLVVGGTSDYSFNGESRASIFDPATGSFLQSQSMADGRWYATATALGDGRIMAFSGLSLSGGTNQTVEIYDLKNAGAGWTSPATAPFTPPLYPRMELLPNGRVFFTGQGGGSALPNSWIFDPVARSWAVSAPTTRDRNYGSAVLLPLLPPSYTPKIMNFGGGNPATSSTEIIDLSAASPSWTPGPDMSTGRIEMNAIILPNGTVLAEGGSLNNESPDTPGKRGDLYDPVTNTFTSAGTASYSRLYHSTALLLPDATVVSMGSNPGSRGRYGPAIEIYTPPYLFDANDQLITDRPSITGVTPVVIGYNSPFSVSYTSTYAISSAVLVRSGSSTHAMDMEQRLIGLCGPSPQPPCNGGPGTLSLTSPPNGNIAPPGYYMLFLLDSTGVPSKAQFIQLSPYTTSPPDSTITSPALDTTITAGGALFFNTNSAAAKYSWVFPGGSPATSAAQTPGNVTFNTPGKYITSLTVIDGSGNSDPSPSTRTITVLPATADFLIEVSPPAVGVVPGQSAAFTVTVTPLTGFNGRVSLTVGSESGFPSGITSGGFTPSSITGITGSGSSILTMNTTTSATPYALSLTITGTAGTITHTASTTLMVNLAAPASLTATAGNAQVSLSWPASVGATSYNVKRASSSGGPYVTVGCTTTTAFTDTGLVNGKTYYYVVSASYNAGPNAGGESSNSIEASATPQGALPALTSLSPSSATAGGPAFTLTANGSNFVSGSTVQWNGASRTTTFVSSTQLTAAIPAGDITTAGTAQVTVVNPAPGGGTSNALTFTIKATNPVPSLTTLVPSSATAGGSAFTLTVNGSNFVSGAVVQWNGASRTTTFVNSTQVKAAIPASDIAAAGTAQVTVVNPAPGGGISNARTLTITTANPVLTVSKSGSGTVKSSPAGINCGGSCSASYTSGTVVTLTATPQNKNFTFTGWSGGGCTGTGLCTVTMDANKTVTATFSKK